jgi:hypothetical protein
MTTHEKVELEIAGVRVTPVATHPHELTRTTYRFLEHAAPGTGQLYDRALAENTVGIAMGDQCVVVAR